MQPEFITVSGRSFEVLAVDDTVLRYPAPLRERAPNKEAFDFWWKMLEFVFALPDPSCFPALPTMPSGNDLAALARYVSAAEEMAESTVLSGKDAMTVHVADGGSGIERIETTFAPNESVRGFTTLFRQFDTNDGGEAASFSQAQRILREANGAAGDEHVDMRSELLSIWGKARRSLRSYPLKVRVGQKLREEGRMPAGIPGEDRMSPETLVSAYQYGDLIHWTEQRSVIEAVADDPYLRASQRMDFLEAVTGPTHVYLGFSLLVRAALGADP